jgi:transcriptional regulator with XRE-family HTH domain
MAARLKALETRQTESKQLKIALGQYLKRMREKANLTQAQVSMPLGFGYNSAVSQIENGTARIPQELYGPWADVLGIPRHEFAIIVLKHLEPGLFKIMDPDAPVKTAKGG